MKLKSLIFLCYLFAIVLLVSTTAEVETSKDKSNDADKAPEEYHVNDGYGGGGWGGYGGGGYGGPGGGGGWGGYGGGGYGGPGGGGGWGGYGGGGYGGLGGGGYRGPGGGGGWGGSGEYGGGGWGGSGDGWGGGGGGHWGCRFGCCGRWFYRGCSRCCRSLTEAITFNEHEITP